MAEGIYSTTVYSEKIQRSEKVRLRLANLLGWHVDYKQEGLSDRDLVLYALREWAKHQDRTLIDPNE